MYTPLSNRRCAYYASVSDFLKTTENNWLAAMTQYCTDASSEQILAWRDCYAVLKKSLPSCAAEHPDVWIIFEYRLPYEAGRRPDVLLVSAEQVLILEFKMKSQAIRADIDQVAAYARDIHEYHYESRAKEVIPILVLTKSSNTSVHLMNEVVRICSGCDLSSLLAHLIPAEINSCNIEHWMSSKYEPLPTIVDAARMIMEKEPLPSIRAVNSTTIPAALECLKNIVRYAGEKKKHMLALVTGAPGAGKTYLGLQFVYDVCESNDHVNSIYLSGNGPLVQVLSSALQSNVFVKDLHRQLGEFIHSGALDFNKNVVVFDEGQRAWNASQMAARKQVSCSEPDLILRLMEQRLNWSVLLVLVGEGQEIYTGEDSNLTQWNTALSLSQASWEVVCPEKLSSSFSHARRVHSRNQLDLNVSLRTHLAGTVSSFANDIIAGNMASAKSQLSDMKNSGFTTLLTRNLALAKAYCRDRYGDQPTKRYGLMASSKANPRIMQQFGIDNSFQATSLKTMDIGSWYNAASNTRVSCCSFEKVVTEFSCQGLELDMPILCWGPDMIWSDNHWARYDSTQPFASTNNTYRRNSYRVLLTRGRDGLIIYVPKIKELDNVYTLFLDLGFDVL